MQRTDAERSPEEERRYQEGLRFARRMYAPRMLGLALGAVCIGTALWTQGAGWMAWTLLALFTVVWPHVAYRVARASAHPYRAELRNLALDSSCGGAWIAAIGFNLLPSAVLVAMLSMDKLAVGGVRLLARCTLGLAAACAATALAIGFEPRLESSTLHILGSLPLLVVYPLTVGYLSYRLARRVRDQNRTLEELSRTDGLTLLLNRRFWEGAVSAEHQRCRRSGRAACLLMIDIDHFKAINDRHGHPAGDEVIRAVAAILKSTLREQDLPGRYGGEEFGVLLPETQGAGAEVIAERARTLVASSMLERTKHITATVSIGIAEWQPEDADHGEWIARADRALYEAKRLGRNRTEHYDPARK